MTEHATFIADWLTAQQIEWEQGTRPGELVVTLPGEHKLKTVVSLLVGDRDLAASAFVIRNPDENHEDVQRLLLRRNLRLRGIAYAVDASGDIYLVGRLPLAAVDERHLDELLGEVLEAADGIFDEVLVRGFLTSMHKEWDWRVSRGESLRNLEAFRPLLERPGDPPRMPLPD